ncbi:recombinase family protein [Vibrio splendidus]
MNSQNEAQVYLYIRFSRKTQEDGDSERRQLECAYRAAERYNLTINESLIMTDRGFSAFKAAHVRKGALGGFLEAVKNGEVAKGSILIVESLDRLSREAPFYAQMQFSSLISDDISILTANDENIYNKRELSRKPESFHGIYAVMQRAHEESQRKQGMSTASIKGKILKHKNGEHTTNFTSVPSWITNEKAGFVLNERANAIRLIIDMYMNHNGLNTISRELAERKIKSPTGKSRWGITTIRKILDNHALYGLNRLSMSYSKDGQTVEENYELENFYPSLITKEEFLIIAERKKKKANSREGYGKVTYLLSSFGKDKCVCSKCGYTTGSQMQRQVNRQGEYTQSVMRLHCRKHKETLDCCSSFKCERLEHAFINAIHKELSPDFLKNQKSKAGSEEGVRAQIANIDSEFKMLMEQQKKMKSMNLKLEIMKELDGLDAKREELTDILNEKMTQKSGEADHKKLKSLASKCLNIENTEERKLFKQILIQSVKRIVVDFETESLACYFENGNHLSLSYIPKTDSYQTVTFYKRKLR